MLNQEYVEKQGEAFSVSGSATFWSRCSSFFMCFSRGFGFLNSATHWIEMRLGRRHPVTFAIAFHLSEDVDGFDDIEVGWHEGGWNPAACCSQREVFFDLQVKAQDLLATIPGAFAAAGAFSRQPLKNPLPLKDGSYTVKDFMQICSILKDLPADDGRLASSLQQENLSGFDAVFMGLCMEAAQKAKRQTQEPQERERRQELTRPLRKTSLPIPSHPFPSLFPWFLHVSFSFDKFYWIYRSVCCASKIPLKVQRRCSFLCDIKAPTAGSVSFCPHFGSCDTAFVPRWSHYRRPRWCRDRTAPCLYIEWFSESDAESRVCGKPRMGVSLLWPPHILVKMLLVFHVL